MKKQGYFLIQNSDGDTTVNFYTKDELLERLDPEGIDPTKLPKFLDEATYMNGDNDTNYWQENMLIIKGEIVVPREVKIVKELDID